MRKPQLTAPQVVGAFCVLLGATVAVRWLFQLEVIEYLIAGAQQMGIVAPMLFMASGLCFFDAQAAQLDPRRAHGVLWWACTIANAALIALPLAYLFESASGVSLGVDIARSGIFATDENPYPGRISPNASLAFLCTGIAFWLLRKPVTGRRNVLCMAMTLVVAGIGLAGLAGHFLGLESLYRFANFNRILPPTAFGLTVASAGLWFLQEQTRPFKAGDAEAGIMRRSLVVVTLVALSCGVAGFAVMQNTFQQSVSQNLLLTATTNATALAHTVETNLWFPETVATRPTVTQSLGKLSHDPLDATATDFLQKVADSLLTAELTAAEFYDARGTRVANAGSKVRNQAKAVFALRNTGQTASLAWVDGFVLLTETVVRFEGERVGRVLTEQRLRLIDELLEEVRSASTTSDAEVCVHDNDELVCAPTRLSPEGLRLPMFRNAGQPTPPAVRASFGERSLMAVRNSRGAVVLSAVAPIKEFGLSLAVQSDKDAIYAPLRSQLGYLVLAVVAIIAIAVYAQRSQVRPVVARLVLSEQTLKGILEEQSEFVSLAKPDGELVYVNPAYARHFGLTTQQMVGANLYEHVQAIDRVAVASTIAAAMRSETPLTTENRMVTLNGAEKWVAWTNAVQRDSNGQPLLHSVGRDVTERVAAERALRDLTTIFDNTTDWVVQADWRGNVLYMNPAVRRALGFGADTSVANHNFSDFNTLETNQLFSSVIVPATKANGVWVGETTVCVANGRVVPVNHMVIAHRNADGRVARYSAVMRDISADVAIKQEQQRQAATLRSVTEAIPAIVAVVGADERYRFVNSGFERWMGVRRSDIIGRTMAEVLGRVEYEHSRPWIERVLAGDTVNFEKAYLGRKVAQNMAITFIPLWLATGVVDGFVNVAQDITQHKQEEIRLLQLTQRDALTGLLNRAGFEQFLESKLVESGSAQSIALLYVDLDRFKPVNDTYGHPVGDLVLQQFAQRLEGAVRPTDAVARLGGDEFAIVLAGVRDEANAHVVADKIIALAQTPFEVNSLTIEIGASVGIAFGADSALGWRDLIARADAMLYRAKAAGRGRHAGLS